MILASCTRLTSGNQAGSSGSGYRGNPRSNSQLPEKMPGFRRDRPDHQIPVQEVVHALTAGFAQICAAVAGGVVEVTPVVLVRAADRIV